jgi:predicted permease
MLAGIVPVFVLLLGGVLARRWGLVDDVSAAGLNRLVANFALPALLLAKVGTSPIQQSLSVRLMVVTTALTVVVGLVGLLLARVWQLPLAQRGVLAQAALRGNIAYVAFPIVLAAHGDTGLRLAAVTAAALIPCMNLVSVLVLESNRGHRISVLRLAIRVLANPLVAATLVGLVAASMHWQPWRWLGDTLKILGDFALPGALLALGSQLTLRRARGLWRPAGAALVLKMAVLPAAGLVSLRMIGASPLETAVGVLLLAAPTAVASYSVAADLGGDTNLAGTCILLTTVALFPTYFVWSLLLI